MIPPGALRANIEGRAVGPCALAVVALAVLELHEHGENITVRSVAARTGYAISTAHRALRGLREVGIVGFEPHMIGTMHVLVERVA